MKHITLKEFKKMIKDRVKDFKNYSLKNENIEELYCSNNQLISLPKLPDTLIKLNCWDNQLSSLPKLPDTLETFECSHNNLPETCSTISKTSGRSVYYDKHSNTIFTGCFKGTIEEFYKKGYIKEKKDWVKTFYELITKN